jgi:hypothetical protein
MIRDEIKQYGMYGTEAEFADKHQELEEKLSCEHCGFLQATEAEAHYLEEEWNTGVGPTYVDICKCNEGKEDLCAAFEEAKDEFFAESKRATLADGYYDVVGIERTFLDEFFYSNSHSELREALNILSLPTAVMAKPYQCPTIIILAREPQKVELEVEGFESFDQGGNFILKGNLPKELLILGQND